MTGALLLPTTIRAQVRDTAAARRDTLAPDTARARRDSLAAAQRADTLKAPIARAELPVHTGVGAAYRWDRPALFASGAVTLLDLLEQVPGLTGFRSGWIASPQHATYMGNATRVRVFLDGLEMDALDPRTGDLLDMAEVQLWALEEVVIERGADEARVHLRSWEVTRTHTYTRTDVMTGDQDTNLYRGYFGRRFRRGQALQVGGQQYGTTSDARFGGGDQLALLGRVGWARRGWSVDAFALRGARTRDRQARTIQSGGGQLPGFKGTRTDFYVRLGLGDMERGFWAQTAFAHPRFEEHTTRGTGDNADTARSHNDAFAAAGYARGGLRLSVTNRLHTFGGRRHDILSGRASLDSRYLSVAVTGELRGKDSASTAEVSLRLAPLSFLQISGTVGRRMRGRTALDSAVTSGRGELGIRLGRLWLSGGVLARGPVTVPPLRVFDPLFVSARDAEARGAFATARGPVWRDIGANMFILRWQEGGPYRPRMESRAELYVNTAWRRRFPSGNFNLLFSVAHEFRDRTRVPTAASETTPTPGFQLTTEGHTLTTRLEIRILDAVIFGQQRYLIFPSGHNEVPGFIFPRRINVYGVRWEFWN